MDVVVFKFRKICPMKNGETMCYLLDKKSPASQTVAIARIAPKKNLPGPAPNIVLRALQISSK